MYILCSYRVVLKMWHTAKYCFNKKRELIVIVRYNQKGEDRLRGGIQTFNVLKTSYFSRQDNFLSNISISSKHAPLMPLKK